MNQQPIFKPTLMALGAFDGKVDATYEEFTGFFQLTIAKNSRSSSFRGIIKDQKDVDEIITNMLPMVNPQPAVKATPVEEKQAEPVKEKPVEKKKPAKKNKSSKTT